VVALAAPELGTIEIGAEVLVPFRQAQRYLPGSIGRGAEVGVSGPIKGVDIQTCFWRPVGVAHADQHHFGHADHDAGALADGTVVGRIRPELCTVHVHAEAIRALRQGNGSLAINIRNPVVSGVGVAIEYVNGFSGQRQAALATCLLLNGGWLSP
jgi:hypothetical protein